VLAEVAETGYDAVEFSRHPMETDDLARTRRLLDRFGLDLAGMSLTYRDRPGCFEAMKEHARVLADLGGSCAVWFSTVNWDEGIVNDDVAFTGPAELADAFAEWAAELGLFTAFHNHLGTSLETPEQMDAVLPRLRHCGLCLDTGHLIAAHGDPLVYTRRYGDVLKHVHFKDAVFNEDGTFHDFIELGEGNHPYDLEATLDAFGDAGYDGWLVLEQDRTRTTPRDSAARNLAYMRRHGF